MKKYNTNGKSISEKIDFIITWVDGSDSEWQEQKRQYTHTSLKEDYSFESGIQRFRDWGLLKYWFRSVEQNAPWVNKIHFVTWGHIPEWLNIDNENINIVRHEEFIPQEYLPTFNSHTIEFNFHNIKELSNNFVYFNDDMFLLKKVAPEDFFNQGLPVDSGLLDVIPPLDNHTFGYQFNALCLLNDNIDFKESIREHANKWFSRKYGFKSIAKNIILSQYSFFPGFSNSHLPLNYMKSTLEEIWSANPKAISNTCATRFREESNITSWIIRYWQLAKGCFSPVSPAGRGMLVLKYSERILETISNKRETMICVNDLCESYDEYVYWQSRILNAFESAFPEKSSYEK